jgi:HEPN domain
MNRGDFQKLSDLRLQESRILLASGLQGGAYYLAGYAVECALKACIAKRTREHDFPEKKLANDSHTHDLRRLMQVAELSAELGVVTDSNPSMQSALNTVEEWAETSRYLDITPVEAKALLEAIEDGKGGLLPWIRLHW